MNEPHLGPELSLKLEHQLSPPSLAALRLCEKLCIDQGLALFLVGGAVRDLVLGGQSVDLDLTINADVGPLANELAARTGGRVVLHKRFGTATVSGRGFQMDLARTRRETYVHPGALPQVEPASLVEDLARRDFTINAVALKLAPSAGEVVDPYRGVADMLSGLVRVLHERSFQDDATRMLRAVRYANRFDFKIAMHTEALIRRDLSYLGTVSGPRLRRELSLLFEEKAGVDGTQLAARLGLLDAIHPALRLPDAVAERWRQALAQPPPAPLDELGFCVTADPRDEGTARSVSKWLHLTGRIERSLDDLVRLRFLSSKLQALEDQPVAAVDLLQGLTPASIWAFTVLEHDDAARTCLRYLQTWQTVRPQLRGDDLLSLGVEPGQAVGEMLRQLRNQRLTGRVSSQEQEVEFVRSHLGGEQGNQS
jgi:tRNA nucleotidyltransferase (CCA-adding enzyme)